MNMIDKFLKVGVGSINTDNKKEGGSVSRDKNAYGKEDRCGQRVLLASILFLNVHPSSISGGGYFIQVVVV